jgi:predicted esterase
MGGTESRESVMLPGMDVNSDSITVAGYSCGSQMAENMLIIESDTIKGAALFNGFSVYGGWLD